ncbi:MAG: hypothetical protein RRC34_09875 [Lentisphaeria bacterium]|nr:hypothetical protein [Lentisphaeria bacterium]
MNHISIASAVPFTVALIIFLFRRKAGLVWLVLTPLVMGLCSLWAVVPDLPRLWKDMALYHRLNMDPRCNMFFFHHSIDGTESDSSWWGALVAVMAGTLLFIAWRDLHRLEKG